MSFNPFKTFTLRWWQGSIFKYALLALGLAVGSTWPEWFAPWRMALLAVFVLGSAYISVVWWRQ